MASDLNPSIRPSIEALPSRLLIVDDDLAMLQALSGMVELRMKGVDIDTCVSGAAALERIGETDYDVIVSDVKMPGMDGFQLMERVLKVRPTTPTLLVTGHGDHDMGVKALNAGAYAFIPKPIDREFFVAWLKRAIQLRQLTRTVEQQNAKLEQTVQERTADLECANHQLKEALVQQREGEQTVRRSEERYRALVFAVSHQVWSASESGQWSEAAPWWEQLTGQTPTEAQGWGWIDAVHPEDRDRVRSAWQHAMETHSTYEVEYRVRGRTADYRYVAVRGVPVFDDEGRFKEWVGTLTDVTESRIARSHQEFIASLQARLRPLVDPDAIEQTAVQAVGEYLNADRCHFARIDLDRDESVVVGEWRRGTASAIGRYRLSEWMTPESRAALAAAEPIVNRDVTTDSRTAAFADAYAEIRVGAWMAVPCLVDGHWTAVLSVNTVMARSWRDDELKLTQDVAARIWPIIERVRVEKALAGRERQLRLIADMAPIYIAHCDTEGRYKFVNKGYAERLGVRPEDCIGKKIPDVVGTEAYDSFRRYVESALAGERVEFEIEVPYEAIGRRFMRCAYVPEVLADGTINGLVAVISDITDRKEAEYALRESLLQYQSTFDNAAVGMSHVGLDGRWLKVNDRLCDITGYSRIELLSGKFDDITHPDDLGADWAQARRLIAGEIETYLMDKRYVHKHGETVWVTLAVSLVRDADLRPKHFIAIVEDITQRRKAEEALQRQLDLTRTITDNATQALLMMDARGYCTFMNPAAETILGFSFEEIRARPLYEMVHRRHRDGRPYPTAECPIDWALPDHFEIREHEDTFIRKNGESFPVLVAASPIFDDERRPVSTVIEVRDITDRKRAEEDIRQRTGQFEVLLNHAPLGVYLVDADFRIRQVNPTALPVFGDIPDLIGRDFGEVLHRMWPKVLADEQVERFRHTLATGEPYVVSEVSEIRHDREVLESYEWRIDRIPLPDGRYGVVCYFRDISAQVQGRKAIAESEERFRTLADNMSQFAWMADGKGWIFWYNRRWFEYTGSTLEEMQGWGWQKVHHPDHIEGVVKRWREAHETGEAWEDTFPLRGKDGNYRWFLSRALPIRDRNGKVIRWFGTNTDITERLAVEEQLREKQEQLVQSAKLANIGELATGVAHEINNPLNNIGLFVGNVLNAMKQGVLVPEKAVRHLEMTLEQTKKAATIIEHLRMFGRRATTPFEPVRLNHVIRSAVSLMEAPLRHGEVELVMELSPDDPPVMGNAIQLEQVLLNLLTNARDAVERASQKKVRIASTRNGSHVEVLVSDTGSGIPAEVQPRLFDPFFTTKAVGKGTGLGLSISYGIIKEHQGRISVESEPHKGTTFMIRLPVATSRLMDELRR